MKVNLEKLVASAKALGVLGGDTTLDVKTKYSIARNIRVIEPELTLYDKQRIEIVKKYGVKIDGTENYQVLPENIGTFSAEIKDLLGVEVEIDIRKVAIDAFASASAHDMIALDWMIDDDNIPEP